MEKEIIEGNKLIAEFMGAATLEKCPNIIKGYIQKDEVWFSEEYNPKIEVESTTKLTDLKYDSSWNWLMPVVERIKFIEDHQDDFFEDYHSINFKMEFFYGVELWIDKDRLYLQTAFGEDTLKDAVYSAVLNFINWYNKTKK